MYKIFPIVLITSFILLFFCGIFSNSITFNDIPCYFFVNFFDRLNLFHTDYSADFLYRIFSFNVPRLIFYVFFNFFNNLKQLQILYIASHYITILLFIILNFIVAKRTKQYFIYFIILLYFFCFNVAYMSWYIRETHISLLVQGIIIMYFMTNKHLKKLDYCILALAMLFSLSSFENSIFISFLYFVFGIIMLFKNKNEYFFRKNIVFSFYGLFSFVDNIIFYNIFMDNTNGYFGAFERWMNSLTSLLDSTLTQSLLISFVGIIVFIVISCILKRKFILKDLSWLIPVLIITFSFLYVNSQFIPLPAKAMNYFLYDMVLPPVLLLIMFIVKTFNIKIKKFVIYNFVLIFSFVGMFQVYWQLKTDVYFYQYSNVIKNYISNSTKPIDELHFTGTLAFYDCNVCTIYRSLLLQEDNENAKTILVADKKHRDYEPDFDSKFNVNIKDNVFSVDSAVYPIKTKFYDYSSIMKNIVENMNGT